MVSRWACATVTLLLACCQPLAAQLSISISPAFVERIVKPGSRVTDTISLTNRSRVPVSVRVSTVDFDASETNEVLEKPSGTDPASLARYLRVSPLQVEVAPDQQVFFRYTITAPKDFTQLRAMLYFVSRPALAPQTQGQRVVFVPRMGVPVYLENIDASAARLRVESVQWKRAGEKGETLELTLLVVNEGERNIRPDGYLDVNAKDGSFAKVFPFNEGHEPVLALHTRKWTAQFGPVPGGELSLKLRFATSSRSSHESESVIPAFVP
ncbi:MAG: hypothetical protein AB1714_23390 [Acidobacteriota bacterium]